MISDPIDRLDEVITSIKHLQKALRTIMKNYKDKKEDKEFTLMYIDKLIDWRKRTIFDLLEKVRIALRMEVETSD